MGKTTGLGGRDARGPVLCRGLIRGVCNGVRRPPAPKALDLYGSQAHSRAALLVSDCGSGKDWCPRRTAGMCWFRRRHSRPMMKPMRCKVERAARLARPRRNRPETGAFGRPVPIIPPGSRFAANRSGGLADRAQSGHEGRHPTLRPLGEPGRADGEANAMKNGDKIPPGPGQSRKIPPCAAVPTEPARHNMVRACAQPSP